MTNFSGSNLRQLCPQLVVPCLRELGQLVDDAVVCDHGEILLVPRDVSDGKADGCEDLLIVLYFHFELAINTLADLWTPEGCR